MEPAAQLVFDLGSVMAYSQVSLSCHDFVWSYIYMQMRMARSESLELVRLIPLGLGPYALEEVTVLELGDAFRSNDVNQFYVTEGPLRITRDTIALEDGPLR